MVGVNQLMSKKNINLSSSWTRKKLCIKRFYSDAFVAVALVDIHSEPKLYHINQGAE